MTNFVDVAYQQTGKSLEIDSLGMREMQRRAFAERNAQYLLLKAPPASGKSRALMFLGLDKIYNQGLKKVIVSVPERTIGKSFAKTELKKFGFFTDWDYDDKYNLCTPGDEVREGPMTLVQGDLRLDNILFTDKNNRAILLDWQTAAVGLPLNDVAYCISTSFLNPNDRASAEEELVKEYHALLEVNDSYSFEQAWNDYRRGSFVGFLMAVMSAMIVERTERGDEMFAVMAERSGWQALHLDAVSFLE